MDPIGWIKTNLILVLGVALAATFLFGSIGTLWYKNAAEKADLRAQVAEASLQTCTTVNKSLASSVDRQNAAVKALEDAGKLLTANADALAAAAARNAKPAKDLAAAIRNFKPPTNATPCEAERAAVEQFYKGRPR